MTWQRTAVTAATPAMPTGPSNPHRHHINSLRVKRADRRARLRGVRLLLTYTQAAQALFHYTEEVVYFNTFVFVPSFVIGLGLHCLSFSSFSNFKYSFHLSSTLLAPVKTIPSLYLMTPTRYASFPSLFLCLSTSFFRSFLANMSSYASC